MFYAYDINGKEVMTQYYGAMFKDDIESLSVDINCGKKQFKRTVHKDCKGRFFTWNKQKVYILDYKRLHMKYLALILADSSVSNRKDITSDELIKSIICDGVRNVRFLIEQEVRCGHSKFIKNTKREYVPYKIEEQFNREILIGYKITLVPEDGDKGYKELDTYFSDFTSMINEGIIKIGKSVGDCEIDHSIEYYKSYEKQK